ncbi:MAG TPA: methyltransferase domain-containing protein [Methanoregula sp.]|nr:methyltransferase domain-containing protein [Methanoregula sp.]
MGGGAYVHGYSEREAERLGDQARTLTGLLHHDTRYPAGSRVLEAGCGTGAQTVILAKNSPGAQITSIDISRDSIRRAEDRVRAEGIANVRFAACDLFGLPFEKASFDHIFICFVLEHLPDPVRALAVLSSLISPGGTITVIEGDHGSAYFHPDSTAAHRAIQCLVDLQREAGGNALIGRELYPLLSSAGYADVKVSPRMVYVDASRPELVEGFTRQTFTAMVEGVRDPILARGLMTQKEWAQGIADLYRTSGPDGVFCYTFFKATGKVPPEVSR